METPTMQTPSESGKYPRPDRVTELFRKKIGLKSEDAAHKRIYGLQNVEDSAVALLESYLEARQIGRANGFLARLVAVGRANQPVRLTEEIDLAAHDADIGEESAQRRFDRHRTRENAAMLVRSIDEEMAAQSVRRQALVAEFDL